jgi:hypothetical protein
VTPNVRVGRYYAAGALVVLTLAKAVGLWGAFLLWPAAGLAITAGAYCGVGPGIFRKTDGRLQPLVDFRQHGIDALQGGLLLALHANFHELRLLRDVTIASTCS